jgi:hypothetical protein
VQIVACPIYWAATDESTFAKASADKSARYIFLGGQSSFDDNYGLSAANCLWIFSARGGSAFGGS